MDHICPEGLRQLRQKYKISQSRLARAIGMNSFDLGRYESGYSKLPEEKLKVLERLIQSLERGVY